MVTITATDLQGKVRYNQKRKLKEHETLDDVMDDFQLRVSFQVPVERLVVDEEGNKVLRFDYDIDI